MGIEVYPETGKELLADWDAGKPCWTVEMGGLSPAYEQANQILTFELLRAYLEIEDWEEVEHEELERIRDAVYDEGFRGTGYSGAQVGAATDLAAKFARYGPRDAVRKLDDPERHMMVSRDFPKAPPAPEVGR